MRSDFAILRCDNEKYGETDMTDVTIKQQLDVDLKASMLARDTEQTTVLRGLKSVILYAEVANGSRESGGIDDEAVTILFAKEAKKRQESADLYIKGGSNDRAAKELSEKAIIEKYLPAQLNEDCLRTLVEVVIQETGVTSMPKMGLVIGAVKAKAGATADGAVIARLVRERLST